MNVFTRILLVGDSGEPHTVEELLPLLLTESRGLTEGRFVQEYVPVGPQPGTGLVHRTWLLLVRGRGALGFCPFAAF